MNRNQRAGGYTPRPSRRQVIQNVIGTLLLGALYVLLFVAAMALLHHMPPGR